NHTLVMIIEPLFEWDANERKMSNKLAGALMVTQSVDNVKGNIKAITTNLLKGFFLSTFVALVLSYLLAKFQVNRINRMRSATKQIASGNFDVHLETKDKDELDDLAYDFNQMA